MEDVRFKRYLENKCFNELFSSLEKYINDNRNNINNTCKLDDISIKSVYLENADNYLFIGYLYVDALVKNFEDDYEDGHFEHYFIKVRGDLSKLDKTFEVVDVDIEKHEIKNPIKDNFLPFYKSDDDYDRTANEFLDKYYPEMFEGKAINVKVLLERLGLKLEYARLSNDYSIFGMMIFENSSIDIYDNSLRSIKKEFHKNTIIVDLTATPWFDENEGMNLFTIIHECVHFYIHKKYFYFQKLMNNKQVVSSCKITGVYDNLYEIKWLEQQANKIASRIIMPEKVIKKYINDYKKIHKLEIASNYEELLYYLKNLFNVSISALKVRLNELGYTKMIGIYERVNNHYIEPYIANNKLENNESYTIDLISFVILSLTNKELKKVLNSEDINYLYIDGHVCINDSKYIVRENGVTRLSNYALNNIDECCLKFKYSFKTNIKKTINEELILCRLDNYIKPTIQFENQDTYKREYTFDAKAWQNHIKELKIFRKTLPNNFNESLKAVIHEKNLTQEKVAEYSNLSVSTIERALSKEEKGIKMKSLMQICVGLRLMPVISRELFRQAGFDLTKNDEETLFINEIISTAYEANIYDVVNAYNQVIKNKMEDE